MPANIIGINFILNTKVCVFDERSLANIIYSAKNRDDNIIFLILDIKKSPFLS